jgi:uncharacterized protein YjdB
MAGNGRTLATAVVVALSSWSCGSTAPDATPEVAAIVVSPTTSTLTPNAQLPLQAQVQDGSGAIITDAEVTWTVQDPRVVSISDAGVVTALAVGTSQVAANSLGKYGIAVITVDASRNSGTGGSGTGGSGTGGSGTGSSGADNAGAGSSSDVATVTITAPSKKLKAGSTMQLAATALDAKGNAVAHQSFVWSSSNTSTATVSASGVVSAQRQGDVTITAQTSAGGKSASLKIEVKK